MSLDDAQLFLIYTFLVTSCSSSIISFTLLIVGLRFRWKTGVTRHTTEAKQRISATLKAKWDNDEQYREYMIERAQYDDHDSRTIRQRISQTLKERWKDPEFRSKMMEQMKNRKSQVGKLTPIEHRQKISQTIREKWQDPTYRRIRFF